MIVDHELSPREQDSAQRIYGDYFGLNSLATTFSNPTLQMLLAFQLCLGNSAVSCIGGLDYLKFFFLPLGFLLARRYGVVKYKFILACCTGILSLLVAASAGLPVPFSWLLFFSSVVLMSICVASGWAMEFPLQKNISTSDTLPAMLTRNQRAAAGCGLMANLAIAWCLGQWSNAVVLPFLFCVAAMLFYFTGRRIYSMPEPNMLKSLAAMPLLPQFRDAINSPVVRRQLLVGFAQNLLFVTVIPMNVIAAKKGCGADNVQVLILSTLQSLSIILTSSLFKRAMRKYGPRRLMISTWPVVWFIAAYWCLAPVQHSFYMLIPPFIAAGYLTLGFSTTTSSYFTMIVPNSLQVGGTLLVYIFHGGLVGLTGLIANPLFFKITDNFAFDTPMGQFRLYYLLAGILALVAILIPIRLPELKGFSKHAGGKGKKAKP